MLDLSSLNASSPSTLLYSGSLRGDALDLDLSTLQDHVSSRAATIYTCKRRRNSASDTTSISSIVALKIVFGPDVQRPHDVRREARMLSSIDHPNICETYNTYEIDSHYIIALPFFSLPLSELLHNPAFVPSTSLDGSNDPFYIVAKSLIYQMCRAVSYLHDKAKIAHRDISPSNWILDETGRIVLVDFGVAWAQSAANAETSGLKGQGSLEFELGTGPYRAPELLFGSRSYDPFALDLWSLGCVIAEFFTPFSSDSGTPESPSSSSASQSGNQWDRIPQPSWMPPTKAEAKAVVYNRSTLFKGGMSDFALIGSIFRTLGTPTLQTWPDATNLPDFGKFGFAIFPPSDMAAAVPNVAPAAQAVTTDLVQGFLQYTFSKRMKASHALEHAFFESSEGHSLLPAFDRGYLPREMQLRQGKSLQEWIARWLP